MFREEDHERDEKGRFKRKGKSLEAADLQEELAEEPKYIPVTPITDEAIERVPFVDIPGYTKEECEEITRQHKELLRYARAHNSHGEVAFVFRDGLKDRKIFKGTDNDIDFGYALTGRGSLMVILHNHPRNKSFSLNDVLVLLKSDELKTLSIVKNNGEVEVITKSDNFDSNIAFRVLQRNIKKYVKSKTNAEYEKVISKTLTDKEVNTIWKK